jgi:hypothetical protein
LNVLPRTDDAARQGDDDARSAKQADMGQLAPAEHLREGWVSILRLVAMPWRRVETAREAKGMILAATTGLAGMSASAGSYIVASMFSFVESWVPMNELIGLIYYLGLETIFPLDILWFLAAFGLAVALLFGVAALGTYFESRAAACAVVAAAALPLVWYLILLRDLFVAGYLMRFPQVASFVIVLAACLAALAGVRGTFSMERLLRRRDSPDSKLVAGG